MFLVKHIHDAELQMVSLYKDPGYDEVLFST